MKPPPFAASASFLLIVGFFAWLVSFLNGCSGAYPPYCDYDGPGAQQESVIAGEPSVDRRSVVQVFSSLGRCSGSVVGPSTVITARHCGSWKDSLTDEFHIGWEGGGPLVVTGVLPHDTQDLMLLYVDSSLPDPILEIAKENPVCFPNLLVQGYGRDEYGNRGGLSERTTLELYHTTDMIRTGTAPCYGDSGSCLVATAPDGTQFALGVSSTISQEDCLGEAGWVNLVTHREWVLENIL